MKSFGEIIRGNRENKGLPLRIVAQQLDIDQAILSKIERDQRRATREQVLKLAGFFKIDQNELLISWLSDKLFYEVEGEQIAKQALQVAEEKVALQKFRKHDKKSILKAIKEVIQTFPDIRKAWIYGSFARGDDQPGSDIDIAVECSGDFSYFDLAEVEYQLEKSLNRKVDIGFIDSFKSHVFENIQPDLTPIFARK